jgi:hypothetical protein
MAHLLRSTGRLSAAAVETTSFPGSEAACFATPFPRKFNKLLISSVRLRLIVGRDRKLFLDPQNFLRCMFPEETLHIRREFA